MDLEPFYYIAVRLFAYAALLVLVVYPLMWLIGKAIPEGRLKTALFRKRDLLQESIEAAERREQQRLASKHGGPSQAGGQSSDGRQA